MSSIVIRLEQEAEYRIVENITREAFWNLYVPGADEHFLLHNLRKSPGFIKELDFVAELDGVLVGNIVYSKSVIKDASGTTCDIITFGPVSVLPVDHGKGIGTALIRHSINAATAMGYKAIAIYGYPDYYQRFGFASSKKFGISAPDGRFLKALMLLELTEGALAGVQGSIHMDDAFELERVGFDLFDASFLHKEKKVTPTQAQFAAMVDMLA